MRQLRQVLHIFLFDLICRRYTYKCHFRLYPVSFVNIWQISIKISWGIIIVTSFWIVVITTSLFGVITIRDFNLWHLQRVRVSIQRPFRLHYSLMGCDILLYVILHFQWTPLYTSQINYEWRKETLYRQ